MGVGHAEQPAAVRVRQLEERVLAAGLATDAELDAVLARLYANASPHNMIVCTLCSCYPVSLLGPSPSWYKSLAYRSRAVREPRAVLAEFGLDVPPGTQIVVWDASAENRFLVLPVRPGGTEGLAEEELAALVTRNGLIGTAAV